MTLTKFDYNRMLKNDLLQYGEILTDIILEELNVRIMHVKDEQGNVWFIRLQNGNVYDCINLAEQTTTKQVFYKEYEERGRK